MHIKRRVFSVTIEEEKEEKGLLRSMLIGVVVGLSAAALDRLLQVLLKSSTV